MTLSTKGQVTNDSPISTSCEIFQVETSILLKPRLLLNRRLFLGGGEGCSEREDEESQEANVIDGFERTLCMGISSFTVITVNDKVLFVSFLLSTQAISKISVPQFFIVDMA